jgi:general stress protein CsbA
MYRDNNILVFYRVILALALLSFLFAVQRASAMSLLPMLSQPLQQICSGAFSSSLLFSIMLIVSLLLAYIKRRKRFCIAIAIILGFASCLSWFSSTAWWAKYDISPAEQKIIAVLLWIIAVIILVSRSTKKEKRRHFTQAVKKHVIRKQKGKCVICKRKLEAYGSDLHHKNGDRSNNKLSNCEVLCTPCHRRKHTY